MLMAALAIGQQHPNRVVAFPPDTDSTYALLSDVTDGGRGMWANREYVVNWLGLEAVTSTACWTYTDVPFPAASGELINKSWIPTSGDSLAIHRFDNNGVDQSTLLNLLSDGDFLVFTDGTTIYIKGLLSVVGDVYYFGAAGITSEPSFGADLCLTTAGLTGGTGNGILSDQGYGLVQTDTIDFTAPGEGIVIDVGSYTNGDPDTLQFRMGEASQPDVIAFTAGNVSADPRLELKNNFNSWRLEASRDGLSKYPTSGSYLDMGTAVSMVSSAGQSYFSKTGNMSLASGAGGNFFARVGTEQAGGTKAEIQLYDFVTTGNANINIDAGDGGEELSLVLWPNLVYSPYAALGEKFNNLSDTTNFLLAGRNGVYLNASDGYYYGHPLADSDFAGNRYLPVSSSWDTIQTINPATGQIGLRSFSAASEAFGGGLFAASNDGGTLAVDNFTTTGSGLDITLPANDNLSLLNTSNLNYIRLEHGFETIPLLSLYEAGTATGTTLAHNAGTGLLTSTSALHLAAGTDLQVRMNSAGVDVDLDSGDQFDIVNSVNSNYIRLEHAADIIPSLTISDAASAESITAFAFNGTGTIQATDSLTFNTSGGSASATINDSYISLFGPVEASPNFILSTNPAEFGGQSITSGVNNIVMGPEAGLSLTTSSQNVLIGLDAGRSQSTNGNNIKIGTNAGRNGTQGSNQIHIGNSAGTNALGTYHIAIGDQAGVNTSNYTGLIDIGRYAGNGTPAGDNTINIGEYAGRYGGGAESVNVGPSAGNNNNGWYNVNLGHGAGAFATANHTVAIGQDAGANGTATWNNGSVFIGNQAGQNETGEAKLYIDNSNTDFPLIYGDFAADYIRFNGFGILTDRDTTNNLILSTTGDFPTSISGTTIGNIAIGDGAAKLINGGDRNILIGRMAGDSIIGAVDNVAIGTDAMRTDAGNNNIAIGNNTSGALGAGDVGTIFIGASAGQNVTGDFHVGIGYNALQDVQNSGPATAVGFSALKELSSGVYNTAFGAGAGQATTTGNYNTMIGAQTGGFFNATGARNTILGYSSALTVPDGTSDLVLLGYSVGATTVPRSGVLMIDNEDTATPLLFGDFETDSLHINGVFWPKATLLDDDGDAGTSGQVLSTTGAGTDWIDKLDPLGVADQTLTSARTIDKNGFDLRIQDATAYLYLRDDNSTAGSTTSALIFEDQAGTDVALFGFAGAGNLAVWNQNSTGDVVLLAGLSGGVVKSVNDHEFDDGIIDVNGDLGTAGEVLTTTGTSVDWQPLPAQTKAVSVEDPTNAENITMFFTDVAITITQVNDVVQGTTPSLTWNIEHATTRNSVSPNTLFGTDRATTSESGAETTTFSDATIPAGSWIWLTTSAQSGTTDEFNVTIMYTYD